MGGDHKHAALMYTDWYYSYNYTATRVVNWRMGRKTCSICRSTDWRCVASDESRCCEGSVAPENLKAEIVAEYDETSKVTWYVFD